MKFCVTTYATQGAKLPEDLVPKLTEWGYDGIELQEGRAYQPGQPKWGLEGRTQSEMGTVEETCR